MTQTKSRKKNKQAAVSETPAAEVQQDHPSWPMVSGTAGLQMVPFHLTYPSELNPRKMFEEGAITELAESIAVQGLLQNLVVRPDGEKFEVVAGGRRWRAIKVLVDAGRLPEDHLIPVRVQELTDLQVLHIATSENVQRSDMSHMEEARVFQQMLELGDTQENIAAEIGRGVKYVRRRLALNGLIDKAQQELLNRRINLAQSEAIATAAEDQQKSLLRHAIEGYSAQQLAQLIKKKPGLLFERAWFDPSEYTGEIFQPLFEEYEKPRYLDMEEVVRLQMAAAERKGQKMLEEEPGKYAFLMVVQSTSLYLEQAQHGLKWAGSHASARTPNHGLVFQVSPTTGEVVMETGYIKIPDGTEASGGEPEQPRINTYGAMTVVDQARARAVQLKLMNSPRISLATLVYAVLEQEEEFYGTTFIFKELLDAVQPLFALAPGLFAVQEEGEGFPLKASAMDKHQWIAEFAEKFTLEQMADLLSLLRTSRFDESELGSTDFQPEEEALKLVQLLDVQDADVAQEFEITQGFLEGFNAEQLIDMATRDLGYTQETLLKLAGPSIWHLRSFLLDEATALKQKGLYPRLISFNHQPEEEQQGTLT